MALYIPPSAAPLGSGRRTSHSGGAAAEAEGVLCDHTLTQVLSWLGVTDLAGSAALVCRQWQQASGCKEVWRRRMHAALLRLYAEGPASAPPAAPGACEAFSPARLFKAVYCTNLLRNGEFLERGNSARSAAVGSARCISWVPTHNGKGLSWEYPLLDPALPLPPPRATHLGGDGSPSEAARRTAASRPINIPRAAAAARSGGGRGGGGSPAGGSLGSSPGSFGAARASPGPFEVGCVAPSCFRWSEVTQVVDLGAALQQQPGLPPALAAAALASGAALEVSMWVASSARGGSPASECQVVAGLASPGDLDTAAAEGLAPECLAKATVPYGDQLPAGLPAAEAQRLSSEAAAGMLATMGLSATRLEVVGPFAAGPEWAQLRIRLRLPAALPPSDEAAAAAALAAAPRLIVALRGRVAAIGTGARGAPRGPKFMAARAVFVAADDE